MAGSINRPFLSRDSTIHARHRVAVSALSVLSEIAQYCSQFAILGFHIPLTSFVRASLSREKRSRGEDARVFARGEVNPCPVQEKREDGEIASVTLRHAARESLYTFHKIFTFFSRVSRCDILTFNCRSLTLKLTGSL